MVPLGPELNESCGEPIRILYYVCKYWVDFTTYALVCLRTNTMLRHFLSSTIDSLPTLGIVVAYSARSRSESIHEASPEVHQCGLVAT